MRVEKRVSPSFQYNHALKTLYKKGKLPIEYGFYGGKLSYRNVSLEHLKPYSKGGKTNLANLVLATKENNQKRSNYPLKYFIDNKSVKKYLSQFINIKTEEFDGNKYIKLILETLKRMGIEI